MTVSIDNLTSSINKHKGVASPTRYKVRFSFPKGLIDGQLFNADLEIMAENLELPGRQIATTPQIIYGVARKMPYGVVYDELGMTFICPNDMFVRNIFDQWHSIITDPTNNYFNYYDTYTGYITIQKTDEEQNANYTIYVEEAFPITVERQILDANATDQYFRLSVRFAYRRWRTTADVQNTKGAFTPGDQVFDGGGQLQDPPAFPSRISPTTPDSAFADLKGVPVTQS